MSIGRSESKTFLLTFPNDGESLKNRVCFILAFGMEPYNNNGLRDKPAILIFRV